jgi:hypothetical protein
MRRIALPAFLLLACACTTVQSSAVSTLPAAPSAAPVAILLAREPQDADELGIVEAHGNRPAATLRDILAEFGTRVASLGGNLARVDSFGTRYEMISENYTYACGTTETVMETRTVTRSGPDGKMTIETETVPVTHHVPKTCTAVRQVEAAILTITGRAFRTGKSRP